MLRTTRNAVALRFLVVSAGVVCPVSSAFAQTCRTTPPPKDAVVLIDGRDTALWTRRNGEPSTWKIDQGVLVASDYDILTKREFGDHQLHLEFWIPPKPAPDTAGNGNSGVFLHGFYEIQIIDSVGIAPHKNESCGAIYGQLAPKSNASLPAGQWQSLDVFFHAPRVSGGRIVSPARMTVYHNDIKIHDNVTADPTPGGLPKERLKNTGPLLLQYHGYPVRFRNTWIRPLEVATSAPAPTGDVMTVVLPGGVPLELVRIRPGKFMMGSPEDALERGIDEKEHEVTITKGFWLGKYEVTNRQFRAFRPDHISRALHNEKGDFNGEDQPVVAVTIADAEAFCRWASEKTGRAFRLPTEAEWEYACRAGSTGRYCFGDDPALLDEYAWYAGNSGWVTHPVGQKRPNAWGLYDMHGNVAEWVSDWYTYYPGGPQTDPKGPASAPEHAWRECSWSSKPYECRCSQRDRAAPDYKSAALGLRVACDE